MDSIGTDSVDSEPPDPNIVEVDPTCRYLRYKDVLNEGNHRTVYKGFDQVDGIEVAWNKVHVDEVIETPQELVSLYSEIRLLKSLKHKNIIKFHTSWIDNKTNTVNIVTELFTSGSLRQYRKKHKKIEIKAVKGWARQILTGLNYLHTHNPSIIHRDLNCDNIFINGNHGEVKIGGLGFATITQQGVGTSEFMTPELCDEEYSELVDIYLFGICLLEMVTSDSVFEKVSSGIKPVSLSKVEDQEVKLFIETCLLPAPQRPSAMELLMDPFLQVDGMAGTISTEVGGRENHLMLRNGTSHTQSTQSGCLFDSDGIDNATENYGARYNLACFEIHMESGDDFSLKGKIIDENTVFFILQCAEENDRVRNIEFNFHLDSDTSLSVAREMVYALEFDDQNVIVVAELIDFSLINMISNWKPSVPKTNLEVMNVLQTSEAPTSSNFQLLEEHDVVSVVSLQNLYDSLSILDDPTSSNSMSVERSFLPMGEAPVKLDDVISQADSRSEDRGMDMDIDLGNSEVTVLLNTPNASSSFAEYRDEEELTKELTHIELQYQLAKREMCIERNEAIMATETRSRRN